MNDQHDDRFPSIRTQCDGQEIQGIILIREPHSLLVEITHPYRLLQGEQNLPKFIEIPEEVLFTGPTGDKVAEQLLASCFRAARKLEEDLPGILEMLRDEGIDREILLEHNFILQDVQRMGYDLSWKARDDRQRFRMEYLATQEYNNNNHCEMMLRFPREHYASMLPFQAQVMVYHALEGHPVNLRARANGARAPVDHLPKGDNDSPRTAHLN